jgi:hypothetical protein
MTVPALEPYTSTYTDVDGSIMDATDLVDEFWRVAYFINLWSGSIANLGQEDHYEEHIEIVEGELAEILPSNGLIQKLLVEADVEEFAVDFGVRESGDPYRIHVVVRCRNPDTLFTVGSPSGESHRFGLNRDVFQPSPVIGDGYYNAAIIATYSKNQGVMVQVYANNAEATTVDKDDVLNAVPQ